MIYSNKHGRYFHNRPELQWYTWKDARDHLYSKQWQHKYGLATQGERLTLLAVVVCVLGVALGGLLLLSGVADGIFFIGIGLMCIWGLTKEGRD